MRTSPTPDPRVAFTLASRFPALAPTWLAAAEETAAAAPPLPKDVRDRLATLIPVALRSTR